MFEGGLAPWPCWSAGCWTAALEGFDWTPGTPRWGAVATLPMLGMFWLALRWPVGRWRGSSGIGREVPVFRGPGPTWP